MLLPLLVAVLTGVCVSLISEYFKRKVFADLAAATTSNTDKKKSGVFMSQDASNPSGHLCPSGRPYVGGASTSSDGTTTPSSETLGTNGDANDALREAFLAAAGGAKKKPTTFAEATAQVETTRKSKVIFIVHGVEKKSGLGSFFGSADALSMDDAETLTDHLRGIPAETDLDLVLHTPGGSLRAAEVIINALSHHQGRIRVHIPKHAASAGTLLALCGHEIHLGTNGYMSPIDLQFSLSGTKLLRQPQYTWGISANDILTYAKNYDSDGKRQGFVADLVRLLRSHAGKGMVRVQNLLEKTQVGKADADVSKQITQKLLAGEVNHDQPLFFADLTCIPQLHDGVDAEIYELFRFYCDSLEKPRNGALSMLGL